MFADEALCRSLLHLSTELVIILKVDFVLSSSHSTMFISGSVSRSSQLEQVDLKVTNSPFKSGKSPFEFYLRSPSGGGNTV